MKYDFDAKISRNNSNSTKWDAFRESGASEEHFFPLWVADMDFMVAEPIRQALIGRAQHGIFGYSYADEDYFQAIINWQQQRHGLVLQKEEICFAPGVVAGLAYLLALLTKAGDGVIIQQPVYYPFARKIEEAGCRVLDNRLHKDEHGYYSMDFEQLEQLAAQAKVMILCSPHNPVGRVWRKEELLRVAEICAQHDIWLISDEIHADLLRAGQQHHCLAALAAEQKQRIITCTSASKSFNLAGLSCASIIIHHAKLRESYQNHLKQVANVSAPSLFAVQAVKAAYAEGSDWLQQVSAYLDGNVSWMSEFLGSALPQAKFYPPEGTYLAWLDISAYNKADMDFAKQLLQECHVVIEPGEMFGAGGEGFLRINFACSRVLLQQAMQRMAEFILKR